MATSEEAFMAYLEAMRAETQAQFEALRAESDQQMRTLFGAMLHDLYGDRIDPLLGRLGLLAKPPATPPATLETNTTAT